jgi:hypothetical protein
MELARIPCGNNEAATIRGLADPVNDILDLVDGSAIRRAPVGPLGSIHPPQITMGVSPFIPDGHADLLKRAHVGISAQKPQKFVDNAFDVQLFGGEQRESFRQIKPGLCAKDRQGSGAGAIGFAVSGVED